MSREILELVRADLRAALARVDAALAEPKAPPPTPASPPLRGLAWGAKVSAVFRGRVRWIGDDLGLDPNHLMACIAWESRRSFRADIKNMAGSGATGLIQFMPATARGRGTTVDALARLTPVDQLNWVWKYFSSYKGRLKTLADIYMAILWPKAVGQPEDYALFTGGVAYRQNAGLDANKDGKVTKREAAAKVMGLLDEGLRPGTSHDRPVASRAPSRVDVVACRRRRRCHRRARLPARPVLRRRSSDRQAGRWPGRCDRAGREGQRSRRRRTRRLEHQHHRSPTGAIRCDPICA